MKRLALLLLSAVILSAGSVQAQSKTVIKLNPFSLAVLTANIQAEHAFGEKLSAQLGVFYGGFSLGAGEAKFKYNWMGITPEMRFYVYSPEEAPEGFYVGPYFRYQRWSTKWEDLYIDPVTLESYDDNITGTANIIGGGAIIGYQFIFGEHFAWDIFLGPGYAVGDWSLKADFGDEDYYDSVSLRNVGGVMFRWGTSIGVAF